ncbi:MraY family glycosyltransferase [Xanthomonas massiliensis]|uniref:MraY family glycosyltransferase n=1 Tax=Xanthomonas massiliensis TaxID=1720302 RepID=UPI001F244190|nr:glycosyltransferase family 4 protein [Xanthomonas massiliensis]
MGAWIALAGIASAAGTWLARRYALARQLLDEPGERRSHQVPTPRGGGAAIVAVMLAVAAGLLVRASGAEAALLGSFVLALALVAGIGAWDDHRPLSPWLRLAVHGLAGALLGGALWWAGAPAWLAVAGALLVPGLVNVWNFMDGINGLAASQALLCAGLFASGLAGDWRLLAWVAAAACLGFLPFNFPRARIFLGDVGSGALGLVLAWLLAVLVLQRPGAWPSALALLPFLADAGFTLVRRMLRGEKWWQPHATHLYQRLARRHGSHVPVTLAYAGVTAVLATFAARFQ